MPSARKLLPKGVFKEIRTLSGSGSVLKTKRWRVKNPRGVRRIKRKEAK